MNCVTSRADLIWLASAVLVLTSCASSPLGQAKQSAATSYRIYETTTPQVIEQITGIAAREQSETITASDRERLRALDHLKHDLDEYTAAQNEFVAAVKTWEQTNREPDNVVLSESRVL